MVKFHVSLPLWIVLVLIPWAGFSQQTVRGKIRDMDSQQPIAFATITIQGSEPLIGSNSTENGSFRLEQVPLGRHTLVVSYIGYETLTLPNIEVTSGKEVVLELEMVESYETIAAVTITDEQSKAASINEFSTISARTLTVEEGSRYAASIADPARQAQNFAGVTGAGDDIYNDIVIRGNSPRGLLWRLEGIEIMNPNHFASLGSSGGAVSMLSSNVLRASDFFTGAFPAEYGNALSGVFDLRFRSGNNEQREMTIGAGFLGLEVAGEGPFHKHSEASYLFNYRYSTLAILNHLGIQVAGDVLPTYQDVSFNMRFPTKKFGTFNLFGVGGNSLADFDTDPDWSETITENEVDKSLTGIAGLKHMAFLGKNAYIKTIASASINDYTYSYNLIENGKTRPNYEESSLRNNYRLSSLFHYKFNLKHVLRTGIILSQLNGDYQARTEINSQLKPTLEIGGNTLQVQAYAQWKWRLSSRLTLNSGLHYLRYTLNNNQSLEPRLGLRWQLSKRHTFNVGAGIHSRTEDISTYLATQVVEGDTLTPNRSLDMSKAAHMVLGYDWQINPHTRLKVETYFQHLYNVPVSSDSRSNFSAINAYSAYDFFERGDTLLNEGTGRNYGLEITLERFLHQNFYFLSTLSLYQSQFSLDGEQYFNTQYNGNYIFNGL
ncbi:MAG: TonB-dependent receptor, partial [Bacteroidota bacterium]